MIDVGFVTLGIIRCNMGDSGVIAAERVEGNRKPSDSSLCFMVLLLLYFFFFSSSSLLRISDRSNKIKRRTCY